MPAVPGPVNSAAHVSDTAPGRRRAVMRGVGGVAAFATALASLPQALAVGFDGSGWDVAVVAVLSLAIAAAQGLLLRPVWRGHRGACTAVAVIQLVGALPAVPAFLLPVSETGPHGRALATVGIVVAVVVAAPVLAGRPPKRG